MGRGKWQLFVSADQPILVMSLLLSEAGNLTNLSTSTTLSPPTPTPPSAEQRLVPVSIGGRTVRLVVRIFRPDGNGPFPTLIFHHGSTGYGNEPLRFTQFWQPDTVIRYFVGRGWSVVLPSRRGRGGSEGGYDEGFAPDRRQGYSGDPEHSLPGADRALADIDAITDVIRAWPFVDADRIAHRRGLPGRHIEHCALGPASGPVSGRAQFRGRMAREAGVPTGRR